jgi:hypothetical protein
MIEDGEKTPKPSKIDDLVGDANRQNAVAFLVTTDFHKAKTVRVNVAARVNQIELLKPSLTLRRSSHPEERGTGVRRCSNKEIKVKRFPLTLWLKKSLSHPNTARASSFM